MSRLPIPNLLAAGLVAGAASTAAAEPNITGMWALSQPAGHEHQAPPPLTDAAKADQALRAKMAAQSNRLVGEAHTKCWPTGMPGLMAPPFGIEFLQTKGRVTILSEVSNLPRTIYLDEKSHPDTMVPGWNGHSIGHWEGAVLVVDTIGFNGRNQRVSAKMHIAERIFLDREGYLVDEMTLDDPVNYTAPYKVRYRYKRAEGQEAGEVMEYVCEVDPANLIAYEAEAKAAGLPSDYDPAWAASAFSNPVKAAGAAPKPVASK